MPVGGFQTTASTNMKDMLFSSFLWKGGFAYLLSSCGVTGNAPRHVGHDHDRPEEKYWSRPLSRICSTRAAYPLPSYNDSLRL
jgi:hypothetical protein